VTSGPAGGETATDTGRNRTLAWLDERLGIGALRQLAAKKTVPLHRHSVWYYFGGMTLFLFGVQVGTGILLMLYYRPSADGAYESVQFIMTQVPFGWLIRSIHSWSANLMVAAAFVHLFSVFFLKAYRAPRELTWVTGFVLLMLTLGFGFSGYLLPWNTLAFFATQVGTEIAGAVPVIGGFLVRFLRGGDHVTGGTLSRFYGWHVAILPAITTFLLLLHLLLVQRHGMSVPPSVERRRGAAVRHMPFVPDFALRDLFGWTVALGVLAALAALFPWELGAKADPFAPAPADIKPEWYFMFMFQALKAAPHVGITAESVPILGFGVAALVAVLVPFLDRNVSRTGRSRGFTVAGAGALGFVAIMTSWGYHAWWPALGVAALSLIPWAAARFMARDKEGP
jgi:cytochrome b6